MICCQRHKSLQGNIKLYFREGSSCFVLTLIWRVAQGLSRKILPKKAHYIVSFYFNNILFSIRSFHFQFVFNMFAFCLANGYFSHLLYRAVTKPLEIIKHRRFGSAENVSTTASSPGSSMYPVCLNKFFSLQKNSFAKGSGKVACEQALFGGRECP